MPTLEAELTVRLDVTSLAQGFLSEVGGPLADLRGIDLPLDAGELSAAAGGAADLDFGGFGEAAARLAEQSVGVVARFPVGEEVIAPLTAALEVVERATQADLAAGFGTLLAELGEEFEGVREGGLLGLLHRLALALSQAPESRVLLDLLSLLPGELSLPSELPGAGVVQAADGAVRALGGLMALETVLAEAERLTAVMAAQLDPELARREIRALEETLAPGGAALAAAVAATDPGDGAAVQAAVEGVLGVAARLEALRVRLSTAMGLGEATLVYLDVDQVLAGVAAARELLRTADLAPLGRQAASLQAWLGPLLARIDLAGVPARSLDTLMDEAEAQLQELARGLAAVDVAALAAPLAQGIEALAGLLERLRAVIETITLEFRGAMGTVRDAVAALPFGTVAAALQAALAPITEAVEAVRAVVAQVQEALDQAAFDARTALREIEGGVDRFAAEVDALFADARAFVEQLDLGAVLAGVAEQVRAFAEAVEAARMAPYFDAVSGAIGTTADVIGAIPFGLLPESMKADVDAAVRPVREVDAAALAAQIESLLQIEPDGTFRLRGDLEAAVADVQAAYARLVEAVAGLDPRAALRLVDDRLKEIADEIGRISPALTLQPLQQAIDRVKEAIAAVDLDALLEPVRGAFAAIDQALESVSPGTLLAPVQERLDQARERVRAELRLEEWAPLLDDLAARADELLGRVDPARLTPRLEAALEELAATLDRSPRLSAAPAVGTVLALLLEGMGLRVQSTSFVPVAGWLGGGSASAALDARAAAVSEAVVRTRDAVAGLDLSARLAAVVRECAALATASATLAATLPDGSPARARLGSARARLDAGAVAGSLVANRARYLEALERSAAATETLRRTGFSQADLSVAALRGALAPLAPSAAWLRELLAAVGVTGWELGPAGVLRALLAALPPARVTGAVAPLFEALRDRLRTLLAAVVDPLREGVGEVEALLEAVDLRPLTEAMDEVVDQVKAEIARFHPDTLLAAPLAAFSGLRQDLLQADPLAAVVAIVTELQAALQRILGKLSLEALLASPLAIYDHLLGQLRALDVSHLLDPVFDLLDEIAREVDQGLDETVAAFQELQAALPGGGGGSTASASLSVSAG